MKKLLLTILLIIQCSLLSATIINIPDDYPKIQYGIDMASEGDTILVQPGTYKENIEIEGKALTLGSLFLTTGDSSYIEQTIIDGDYKLSSISIEDCQNGFTTICGFKIVKGNGNSELVRKGGGIFVDHSLAIIRNNIIADNKANMGGGVFTRRSEVYVQDNSIYNNIGLPNGLLDWGGGIRCDTTTVEMRRCDIYSNESEVGGGICFNGTGFIVEECKICDNRVQSTAGGMFLEWGSYGKFINCEVSCNEVDGTIGGGFSICMSEVTFCDVLISGNSSVEGGGAGYFGDRSNITFTNCTIVGNSSPSSDSGELICGGSSGDPSYCTITNSIFYNNASHQIEQINSDILIQYSDIEGGEDDIIKNSGILTWGDGNIDYDPLFADVEPFPYELSSSSPCVNAGTPDTTGLHLPLTDLAGTYPRVWFDRIDMGAYECKNVSVDPGISIVEGVSLYQNSPNPFRNGTEILFTVKDFSHIDDYSVSIYNTKGQLVRTFAGKSNTERTKIAWDGTDGFGRQTSPGVYLYKLEYGEQAVVRKMVKLY